MRHGGSEGIKPTRQSRLEVMRLEDRIVPGELFSSALLWAMGSLAGPAAMALDTSTGGQLHENAQLPAANRSAERSGPFQDDLASLSFCQFDNQESGGGVSAPTSVSTQETTITSAASDQAFSNLPSFDLGNTLNPMSPAQAAADAGSSGGTSAGSTAVVSNSAGATNGALVAPGGSSQSIEVSNVSNVLAGASLNSSGGSGLSGATAAAAQAQAQAGAAENTPQLLFHAVSAPGKGVHSEVSHLTTIGGPYDPAQISTAYGFNLISNNGSGQTIYIIDAYNDPNISKDLATFDSEWSLPAPPTFTVHEMSSRIRNSSSWGVEESLDVEWSHAMAPQAKIVLVEATSSSNANLYAAVNYANTSGAHIVSMSWGGSDSSSDTSDDTYFNHTGVTYLASSGDTGAEVIYPSSSPYVVSTGGTSLTLNSNNTYASESAWTDGGGGTSKYEKLPGYQSSFGISYSGRSAPDVSYNSDPNNGFYVYDSYISDPGWYEVGGTSAAAPQWAAIVALADQGRSTPLSSNNLTSRTEYNAAVGSLYATNYHDVTTGSNGHSATAGYDQATGIGSPVVNNLVPWLISNS